MTDPTPERALLDELANIVQSYPLWPGDTISHATARQCEERGWARREAEGSWVPTPAGLRAYERYADIIKELP